MVVRISWEIIDAVLLLRMAGDVQREEMSEAIAAALKNPQFKPDTVILFDGRLLTASPPTEEIVSRTEWLATLPKQGFSRRFAMVVGPGPLQLGLAKMMAGYLRLRDIEMEVFSDMRTAWHWLTPHPVPFAF